MSVSSIHVCRSGLGTSPIGHAARAVVESLESRTLLSSAGLSAWAGPGDAPVAGLAMAPSAVVAIPDANLNAAVHTALGIAAGTDISDTDMLNLTSLDANSSGIADLTGLEFATNLASADLSGNQIANLTPLSGLTNLTTLSLANNQITDVTPLAGMTQLTTLSLKGNQITDITSLASLTSLLAVDVSDNNLDLTAGSPAQSVITGWMNQGTTVTSEPQNTPGTNEAPTDILLSSTSVPANQPIGTVVGTFSAVDPNPADTFTFTLVDGTGSDDNASFTIDGNQLKTAAVFDPAVKNSFSILVQTTDEGGLSFQKQFTIRVAAAGDQAPTNISLSNNVIASGQPAGTVVGTLSASDPDPGDTFTFALVNGTGSQDNASFMIVGNELQTATVLDSSVQSVFSIRVQTTDQGGLTFEKPFIILVGSVRGTFGTINGKNVTLKLQDLDGDMVTFKLTGGGTGQVFGTDTSFDQVLLTGTTNKSVLTITVKKASGGDGFVTISNIVSDGLMKTIKAVPVIGTGEIQLNTLRRDPGKTAVAMQFQQFIDANVQSQNLPISSLKLLNWQNTDGVADALVAPSIGSITVSGRKEKPRTLAVEFLPGDLQTSVTVSGAINSIKTAGRITGDITSRQDTKGKGIGSITATLGISGASIITSGSINTVKVGALTDTDILVGVAPNFAGRFAVMPTDFVTPTAKLKELTVKGAKLAKGVAAPPFVVNSNISAPNVGTISLLNVPAETPAMVFVLNDKGTLKISQTKDVSEPMVPKGTFKAPKDHSTLWQVVA